MKTNRTVQFIYCGGAYVIIRQTHERKEKTVKWTLLEWCLTGGSLHAQRTCRSYKSVPTTPSPLKDESFGLSNRPCTVPWCVIFTLYFKRTGLDKNEKSEQQTSLIFNLGNNYRYMSVYIL